MTWPRPASWTIACSSQHGVYTVAYETAITHVGVFRECLRLVLEVCKSQVFGWLVCLNVVNVAIAAAESARAFSEAPVSQPPHLVAAWSIRLRLSPRSGAMSHLRTTAASWTSKFLHTSTMSA